MRRPRLANAIAEALRAAHVARAFVADGVDVSLAEVLRNAGVSVAAGTAASACVMAATTGLLGDAPGVAIVAAPDHGLARVLADARREHAPCVLIALAPLPAGIPSKTIDAGDDSVIPAVAEALAAATDEPPGPVCLCTSAAKAESPGADAKLHNATTHAARPGDMPTRLSAIVIDVRQVDAVAQRLAACERPLIVAGRECRAPQTAGWLRAFAESLPAPVLVTPAARGVIPDPHPLAFGLVRADAAVLARADLTIALGVDAAELDAAGITLPGPVARMGRAAGNVDAVGDVPSLLEELASRLRGRVRVDWDVAELDRLRRAIPAPAVDAQQATLVTRVREATPAGTAVVFARALEPLAALWQATEPAELFVTDAVIAAATAVALARPGTATVVFARGDDAPLVDVVPAVAAGARVIVLVVDGALDDTAAKAAGARVTRPLSLPALLAALGDALDREGPTIIAVPRGD